MTLQQLIKKNKLTWVNSDINSDNFPMGDWKKRSNYVTKLREFLNSLTHKKL